MVFLQVSEAVTQIPSTGNGIIDALIAFAIAIIPIVKMQLSQRGALRKIVEQIKENDAAQSVAIAQMSVEITTVQSELSEIKEETKSLSDSRRATLQIQKSYVNTLAGLKDKRIELEKALQKAKDLFCEIATNVILFDFETTPDELRNSIGTAALQIKETFKDSLARLSDDFVSGFSDALDAEITDFIVQYAELRTTMTNGTRRKTFMESCAIFTKRVVIATHRRY